MCNENEDTKTCPICNGSKVVCVKTEPFHNDGHPKRCGITSIFDTCWACNGTGQVSANVTICEKCKGKGVLSVKDKPVSDRIAEKHKKCKECNGKGVC